MVELAKKSKNDVNKKLLDELEIADKAVVNSENSFKTGETNGFKFALTIIVASSTISYTIYNYVQSNPINTFLILLLSFIFSGATLLVLSLITYIIIKGMSFEVDNHSVKDILEKLSSLIYFQTFRIGFGLFLIYTLGAVAITPFMNNDKIPNMFFMLIVTMIAVILAFISGTTLRKVNKKLFGLPPIQNKSDSRYLTYASIIFALSTLFFPSFFNGDIKVTMNDINNTYTNHIPVYIVTPGSCTNLTINLTETNVEGNLTVLDSIKVHPTYANEVIFGKYLRSSTLGYGKYKIFINTTNLTQGYYDLSVSEDASQIIPILFSKKKTFDTFFKS